MKNDPSANVFITEYINVGESPNEWVKLWGKLIGWKLTFIDGKNSEKIKKEINLQDVEIQPAVKETGKLLAFKLVNKGKTLIILEPLNITDMGRWISSLFAAIQGVATLELNSSIKGEKKLKAAEWNEVVAKTRNGRPPSDNLKSSDIKYSVKVKDLARIYETMSTSKEDESKKRTVTVRRSHSSPNLSAKPVSVEVITKSSTKTLETTKPTAKSQTVEKVAHSQTSYLNQEVQERQMLANLMNPQLAKQRLGKQQQQIQRLEVTMKSVVEKVKRQKKSLEETEVAIKELESQATTEEDFIDVVKLQDQKRKLEVNIVQSEANIEEYRGMIEKVQEEMKQLEQVIADNETSTFFVKKEETSIKSATEPKIYVVTENIQLSYSPIQPSSPSRSKPSAVYENNNIQGEPEWVRKARQKSEAINRLAQEGRIN